MSSPRSYDYLLLVNDATDQSERRRALAEGPSPTDLSVGSIGLMQEVAVAVHKDPQGRPNLIELARYSAALSSLEVTLPPAA